MPAAGVTRPTTRQVGNGSVSRLRVRRGLFGYTPESVNACKGKQMCLLALLQVNKYRLRACGGSSTTMTISGLQPKSSPRLRG